MRFSEYMSEWLYGKDGYYSKYKEIGKDGDFYTAVSSSQFFGGSIAKEFIKIIESGKFSESSTICEIGAHKGYLTADIIQFIYTLRPELLKTLKFAIIEKFEYLRKKQKEYLKESFGDDIKVEFFESLDQFSSEETLFIANEIFDAFPCELYYKGKIGTFENGKIEFLEEDLKIGKVVERYGNEKGEVAIGYLEFAKRMKKSSNKFEFITFDYGDIEPRPDFSIRVYQKHKVLPLFEDGLDFENMFGKSDITFDVNFQYLKDEFESIGIEFIEYKTQMKALIDFGLIELLEMLQKNVSQKVYSAEMNRAKILIDPSFMGERFKMIRFFGEQK